MSNPYRNYQYQLIWEYRYVSGFSRVLSLTFGSNSLSFEKGVTQDLAFQRWARKVSGFGLGFGQTGGASDMRKDVVLRVVNPAGHVTVAYRISHCWVSVFLAMPDLDADGNSITIMAMKMVCGGWERDWLHTLPGNDSWWPV